MHQEKYKTLARKYGITTEHARKVCESQFEFTKDVIQSGEDAPVRLQYLGKFEVKPGRRASVKRRSELTKELKNEKNRQA